MKQKSPHFIEDCPSWKIPGTDWVIQGHSVAGERTGFAIPSLRLFFDAGCNTYKNCEIILLTHSHSDHSFNVPCIAMGQGDMETRPTIYAPKDMIEPLKLLCRASQALNDCRSLTESDVVNTIPAQPGDVFQLPLKTCKTKLIVEIIECCHTVPSIGFLIKSEKSKLKNEYKNLPGKEIAKLKQTGVDVTETSLVNNFMFLGDTTAEIFEKNPNLVAEVPVIFIECTLLDAGDENKATDRGHVHWSHLKPYVVANPKTVFVLMHWSRRYSDSDVIKFFEEQKSQLDAMNVLLWLDSGVVVIKK
eukprot:TRINITY_DN1582_c0_g1_i1.p1 TRINITY_DN1582_c0_g1~~TRINITY_DN1582_c0_g1_i1.p1  ORF type:complete len:303 (-),score=43.48 TRINITY_DN1582_c0_g1_i1:11-919(-)